MKKLWTIGYRGRTPDEPAQVLFESGVKLVGDVRADPEYSTPGFSCIELPDVLGNVGIAYMELCSLGITRLQRRRITDEMSRDEVLAWYRTQLDGRQRPSVLNLAQVADDIATALLCAEREPQVCHRHILAEVLADISGFEVVHL